MNPAGRVAERRVRCYFRLRGYRLLGQNVRAAGGELDLIVRRGSRIVFCEVKMRSAESLVDPLEAVGPDKARRLRRAAETWLSGRPDLAPLDVGFEVATVKGRRIERYALFDGA